MKTYSDLWHWLRDNKGLNVAERLNDEWIGGGVETPFERLSDVLLSMCQSEMQHKSVMFWNDVYNDIILFERGKPYSTSWQLTATFDGETHRLTGSTKKELITTLAMLIIEVTKEEE